MQSSTSSQASSSPDRWAHLHFFLFQTTSFTACILTQNSIHAPNFSENSQVVDMVLLDMPRRMDSLRADRVAVRGFGGHNPGPRNVKATNNQVVRRKPFWISSWFYGASCSSFGWFWGIFRLHVCLLHQDIELPDEIRSGGRSKMLLQAITTGN